MNAEWGEKFLNDHDLIIQIGITYNRDITNCLAYRKSRVPNQAKGNQFRYCRAWNEAR